ncbi:MAG: preprotein translocase subunit YajC [Phycisphaerales bacterium]|nr:preprotein translocase subunit YajC [Phycisphaerales bacterium]
MTTATWGLWVASAAGLAQDGQLPGSVPGLDSGGGADVPITGDGTASPTGQTQGPPSPFSPMFLMLALVVVFMIITTTMSGRKEKKRAANMLASLKRGDRVQTMGGMIGTVHEVKEDSIVLRIDDLSGAKAHFSKGAVQAVLKAAKSDSKGEPATAE